MLFLGVQASYLLRKQSGWLCFQVFAGLIACEIEHVMGFCTPEEYRHGLDLCPQFAQYKELLTCVRYRRGMTTVIAIGIGLTLCIEPGRYINADMIKSLMEGNSPAPVPVEANVTHPADQIVALIPSSYVKLALTQDMLGTVVFALLIGCHNGEYL